MQIFQSETTNSLILLKLQNRSQFRHFLCFIGAGFDFQKIHGSALNRYNFQRQLYNAGK